MSLRIWRFVTILLASLLMATAFGHLLEMPMKMRVSGELWLTFQHTLYAWFAIIGGPIELLTILSTAILAYRVRRSSRLYRPTLVAAIILASGFFGIWLGLINPVNSRTASWTIETIPSDWQHWRSQWEYSHAARFVLSDGGPSAALHWVPGFGLAKSSVRTPCAGAIPANRRIDPPAKVSEPFSRVNKQCIGGV